MRNYNRLIIMSLLLYGVLALWLGYEVYTLGVERENSYRVEINRILDSLSGAESPDRLDLRYYETVHRVTFLPVSGFGDGEAVNDFFEEDNRFRTSIQPWMEKGEVKGLLHFAYKAPTYRTESILFKIQLSLLILELSVLSILLYLKYRVLKPFERMSSLPLEFAKGHLNSYVKEEKNRYFGRFLWGLGQLKDTLEAARRREQELMKDKKKLLLSLSHDIKTPLNTIRLYGKALEEDLFEGEEQRRHAMHQIGVHAAEIEGYVDEIMISSREDILDVQVKEEEFYLEDLMKGLLDTYEERCRVRMLKLSVEPFGNRLLQGDREKALEVLENIMENAIKYGDGKVIRISFLEEDYCQLIRIFNTGKVVSDNEFNHLFESFFRGSNSEGKKGSGLGLYICRELMRKMGGEIFAEKEEDGMAFVAVFR